MKLRMPHCVISAALVALSLAFGRTAAAEGTLVPPPQVELQTPRPFLVELEVPRGSGVAGVAAARARFMAAFGPHGRVTATYEHLPYVVVDSASLDVPALGRLAGVRRAFEPKRYRSLLVQSLPLVGQPEAVRRGVTGKGASVVVIDSGADWTSPDLGSCTAPGTPGCRIVHAQDFGGDDGLRDVDVRHGTNVASIVARMAPEAGVIALDAFLPGNTELSEPTVLEAMDWTLEHQHDATFGELGIVAVNLSIGEGRYESTCPDTAFAGAIDTLRQAGVSVVAASGNDGWTAAMDAPACVPGVLSVGNVYDAPMGNRDFRSCQDGPIAADTIQCLSNASAVLALLAPGSDISAGGVTLMGTSMASPHVAGAVALLRGLHPDDPPDTLESRLTASGKPLVDPRNGLSFPRLDVAAALDAAPDTEGPTGAVSFDRAWYKSTALIRGRFGASDASGTLVMCVSLGEPCEWTLYQRTLGMILPEQDEPLTVAVWYADRWSNMSGPFTTVVGFDGVAPVDGVVTASVDGRRAVLAFDGGSDAKSGLDHVVVVEDAPSADVGCQGAALAVSGGIAEGRVVVAGLAPGSRHLFRLCLEDRAGNRSRGVVVPVVIDANAAADDGGDAVNDAGAAADAGCGCAGGATDLVGLVAAGFGLVLRRRRTVLR